jgi:hypothetical protein
MAWQPTVSEAVGKLLGAGSCNNHSQAFENENAVSAFVVPISTVGGAPVIRFTIDNEPRQFVVDTGGEAYV